MAFRVALHSVRLKNLVLKVVVIFSDHISDRPSPVEEETFRLFGAVKDHSCQSRHPAEKVVAFACLELREHIPGPCLRTGLVAVGEEIFNAAFAEFPLGGVDVSLEVVVEIFSDGFRVEFVNLKSRGFRRGGVIGLACQAVAEAEYSPVAFRCGPIEDTVLDVRGQVHDIIQPGRFGAMRCVFHPEQTVETVTGFIPSELDSCHS